MARRRLRGQTPRKKTTRANKKTGAHALAVAAGANLLIAERWLAGITRSAGRQDADPGEEVQVYLQQYLEKRAEDPAVDEEDAADPLLLAQQCVYRAYNEDDPEKRIAEAQKALEYSTDCADAYVLLAEEDAVSFEGALAYYERGVEAGWRALGGEDFEQGEGRFWERVETRPYMRAAAGRAEMLWLLGQRSEAIDQLQDLLRLDPEDNQGLRYRLADYLFDAGRDGELEALLARYEDDPGTLWAYLWALCTYRREGDSPRAVERLREAVARNPYVPNYLLGRLEVSLFPTSVVEPGEASEAEEYAPFAIRQWRRTDGALFWLRQNL